MSGPFLSKVKQAIDSLHPDALVIVTCRSARQSLLQKAGMAECLRFEPRPVNPTERDRFINLYCRADGGVEGDRATNALLQKLQNPQETFLQQMAENPLFLTILCRVARDGSASEAIPSRRAPLFERGLEILLDPITRSRSRIEQNALNQYSGSTRSIREDELAALEWMAFKLWCNRDLPGHAERSDAAEETTNLSLSDSLDLTQEQVFTRIEAAELIKCGLERHGFRFHARKRANELLNYVTSTFLLTELDGDKLTFVHPTFQEFLAASALKRRAEKVGFTSKELNRTLRKGGAPLAAALQNADYAYLASEMGRAGQQASGQWLSHDGTPISREMIERASDQFKSNSLYRFIALLDRKARSDHWQGIFQFLAGLLEDPAPLAQPANAPE